MLQTVNTRAARLRWASAPACPRTFPVIGACRATARVACAFGDGRLVLDTSRRNHAAGGRSGQAPRHRPGFLLSPAPLRSNLSIHTFSCIDGHTCGNPVRLVAGGGPQLEGANMLERRAHFLRDFDWIRTGLMFEPRGHDMMSGSILYAADATRLRRCGAVHRNLWLPADVRTWHDRHDHDGHRERPDQPTRSPGSCRSRRRRARSTSSTARTGASSRRCG